MPPSTSDGSGERGFRNPLFGVEGAPTDAQKNRLEDWLTELKIICRRYGLLLDTEDGETRLIDLASGRIVGMGLTYLVDQRNGRPVVSGYDVTDSILDGTWPVDSPEGLIDQRLHGNVWPGHPYNERY